MTPINTAGALRTHARFLIVLLAMLALLIVCVNAEDSLNTGMETGDSGNPVADAVSVTTCSINCDRQGTSASMLPAAQMAPRTLGTTGKYLFDQKIKGYYLASGIGLRNRGWGTILIRNVTAGSTVNRAYLFWTVISPSNYTSNISPQTYGKIRFNGNQITGTFIGVAEQPCWGGGRIYGYRAEVTSQLDPTGVNQVRGVSSGYRWGDKDPWSGGTTEFPLADGASLVVVYNNRNSPVTSIQIIEGVQSLTGYGSSGTASFGKFINKTNSTNLVGKTTFIVADGQSNVAKTVLFNGVTMPSSFVNGSDPQDGVAWKNHNLWDTNTADVLIPRGSTEATASITTNGDCVTWVAQVLSVASDFDSDGDGLWDQWEIYGYDYNGDGVIDVDLPALGASPYHKDLFVQIDFMAASTSETQSHRPDPTVISRAVETFANAPVTNPDGTTGINLHIEVNNSVPHQDDLDLTANWSAVDAIKATYFPPQRQAIYHYCLFGHMYNGDTSSGLSRGIPASDFIVTLGGWETNPGTPDEQTGTFIHEFGHNLGLKHGGNDHVNYKPNYLSIMNYFFQMSGVYRNGSWGHYDYQRIEPTTLNENALNKATGIGEASAGYGTLWSCPNWSERASTIYKPIDWNCNGKLTGIVASDINYDGMKTSLNSQNNWKNIVFNGGGIIGHGGSSKAQILQQVSPEAMPPELTYEENENISRMRR